MNKNVLILSFIIASRFFALFIVLPVISLYAKTLSGANDFLVGLIVGIYAISQMIFSVPFGAMSDKFGRKKTMLFGLVIFIIGSLICANSSDIFSMLIGRIIQGAGAIGGVATAMIADVSSEKNRAKAMALMGGSIGLSFILAMPLGSLISAHFGLSSLFYLSAVLSLICIVFLLFLPSIKTQKASKKTALAKVFEPNLNRLFFTCFMQKMLLTSTFMIIPIDFVHRYGGASKDLVWLYLIGIIFGFFAMGLGGVVGESKGKSKHILITGVALFALSSLGFLLHQKTFFYLGVAVFFIAFCLHEPIMQSSISKIVASSKKGLAMGLSNACGYFGSFLGAAMCGIFMHNDFENLYLLILIFICLCWLFLLKNLDNPNDYKSVVLDYEPANDPAIIECKELDNGRFLVKYNCKKITFNQ